MVCPAETYNVPSPFSASASGESKTSPSCRARSSRSFGEKPPSRTGIEWTSRFGKKMRSTISRANDTVCPRRHWLLLRVVLLAARPVGVPPGPGRIGVGQRKPADAVVFEPADVQVALVLAHRGN